MMTFYYKNNRLQQLRGFYYAASFGHVTKAAEYLRLTQPSVSLQIKSLERDLECRLFKRHGPLITLTPEGHALFELIKPLIEGIDNLKENFKTLSGQREENRIHIAANQATMLYLLPKLIKTYTHIHPHMKVKIHAAVAEDGLEKLRNGEVDIIVGPVNFSLPEEYVYTPLFHYDPVLITRAEHPLAGKKDITLHEMAQYQLILPPSHLRTITSIENVFNQHNIKRKDLKLEFDGWEIIKRYVELDMAITIALSIAIEDDPILVGTKLNHYFPRSSYGIILRRGQVLSKKIQGFIETIELSGTQKIY